MAEIVKYELFNPDGLVGGTYLGSFEHADWIDEDSTLARASTELAGHQHLKRVVLLVVDDRGGGVAARILRRTGPPAPPPWRVDRLEAY